MSLLENVGQHIIPKISPGAYIFQRPFFWGFFWRGLSIEGHLRFKIDWTSLKLEGNLPFLLCFTLYLKAISKYKPGSLICGGAYFRTFTVLKR